jgi:hypothetical protein
MLTDDDVQKFVGKKIIAAGIYPQGYWLELDNGQKIYVDDEDAA